MKAILLDTHAFLWFVFGDPQLSANAEQKISNPKIKKSVSMASLWEIVIKCQIGKLGLGTSVKEFFKDNIHDGDIELIDISIGHLIS